MRIEVALQDERCGRRIDRIPAFSPAALEQQALSMEGREPFIPLNDCYRCQFLIEQSDVLAHPLRLWSGRPIQGARVSDNHQAHLMLVHQPHDGVQLGVTSPALQHG